MTDRPRRPLIAVSTPGGTARGSGTVEGRRPPIVVSVVAAAGVGAAIAVEVVGRGAFPTHPLPVVALGLAATAVWSAARVAPGRCVIPLRALACSLLIYLWSGVVACAVDDRPHGALAELSAAVWSSGWIPVNGLVVVVGLTYAAMPRSAIALSVSTALTTIAGALLAEPTRPFTGLPTAAPESWSTRAPWLADGLLATLSLAMVIAVVGVGVRVVRAHPTERRHLVSCAATCSTGIGLVVMCLALAAARDPGDVDPSTGSAAYVVAIGVTAVLAAFGNAPTRWPLRAVVGYWVAAVVLLAGMYAVSLEPTMLAVGVTALTAVGVTVSAALGVGRLERWLSPSTPRLVTEVALLSPRENEVLAAAAAGATNAGIAADLFLSERTVEQHLRSIFAKLDLGAHDSSNRRVRAAAIWWQHQSAADDDRVGGAP